jgi:hypothetical protein
VPDIPLQARPGREAFLERRDSEAEADHGRPCFQASGPSIRNTEDGPFSKG